ncbi:MAG: hypothetical protein AB1728_13750 [Bacteroidota bacterium]
MIASAFLVLLTIAVINANKLIVDSDTAQYEMESIEQAGHLANSLLSEIAKKKFDENVDTSYYGLQPLTDFTSSAQLGTDPFTIWGRTYNESYLVPRPDYYPYSSMIDHNYYYDDIDDYDGYFRIDTTNTFTRDTLRVEVYYITPNSSSDQGYDISSSRTYFKKVDVHVINRRYFSDTLTFSTIIAY